MCRYIDCETNKIFHGNSAISGDELPIDEVGYCLFHSQNDEWQIENNFNSNFLTLIQDITELNKDINVSKWNYNFEGFNFPKELDIEINKFECKGGIKFTGCNIKSASRFTNCSIRALTVNETIFQKNLIFDKTNINKGIYSKAVSYKGSFRLLQSNLEGSSFFINNDFTSNSGRAEFLIKKCDNIEFISFDNSFFNISTAIVKSTLNKEIQFVDCKINDEFIFDDNIIKDSLNFNRTNFTITENVNPIYSSTQFENITLTKTGKITFKGKKEQENVVLNELSISFKIPPLGLIIFENFNLNKIFHKSKTCILSLEKQGIVEIGRGCRKYYCQTDNFTISTNNATQELILSLTKIFCNYFEFSEHKNLGVEIVERTHNKINFFYFTDDKITYEEFIDRLKSNEYNMWNTFSKLTTYNTTKIEDINIQLLLNDISSFFLKLGTLVNHKTSKELDILYVLNSISGKLESNEKIVQGKSILDREKLISAIKEQSINFFKKDNYYIQIKNTNKMNITNNYNGSVEKVINAENFFENHNVSEKQKKIISNELNDINNELDIQKKESKLKKFFKEWSGTITEVGMTLIKNVVL